MPILILAEDALKDFAAYLKKTGLSKLKQFDSGQMKSNLDLKKRREMSCQHSRDQIQSNQSKMTHRMNIKRNKYFG